MAKAVRLDKFLADAGKGTRSEVKKFIQKGQVQVNGAPAKKPELKVDPEKDTVILSGETVGVAPEFVYYLLNKPIGYVTTTMDKEGRPTVLDLVQAASVQQKTAMTEQSWNMYLPIAKEFFR